MRINPLIVRLLALAHHIERIADMNRHQFILRRVVDPVFANEQHVPPRILLVNAHVPRWHRHSKAGLLLVLEFVKHHHVVFQRRTGILLIVVIPVLSVHHKNLLHRHVAALQQTDLLRLFVFDGSLPPKRIQVIFTKILLRKLLRLLRPRHSHIHRHPCSRRRILYPVQIARHQLQPRIVKRRPAVVRQRHPAVQVRRLVVASNRQHIIRIPCQIRGQIRCLHLLLPSAFIFQ